MRSRPWRRAMTPRPAGVVPYSPTPGSTRPKLKRRAAVSPRGAAKATRVPARVVRSRQKKPVDGEIDTSSGFGVRIDPFLGRPAMHTGTDFRGDTGEAVRRHAGSAR